MRASPGAHLFHFNKDKDVWPSVEGEAAAEEAISSPQQLAHVYTVDPDLKVGHWLKVTIESSII